MITKRDRSTALNRGPEAILLCYAVACKAVHRCLALNAAALASSSRLNQNSRWRWKVFLLTAKRDTPTTLNGAPAAYRAKMLNARSIGRFANKLMRIWRAAENSTNTPHGRSMGGTAISSAARHTLGTRRRAYGTTPAPTC